MASDPRPMTNEERRETNGSLLPATCYLLPFWLALFLFSVYLLSFSGKFHVMDELAVFTAANNLAQRGRADIDPLIWTNHWTPNPPGIWGREGHLYTKKAPGISFIAAPLIWLGHALPGLNAAHVGLLANAIVTALTAGFLFVWLTDLGFCRTAATLATLGYGLGTIAWVYARMFWESSMLALSFLVAVWAAYRATRPSSIAGHEWRWTLLAGVAIGAGLTLRFETVPAVAFIGLYLLWESAKRRRGGFAKGRIGEEANRRRAEMSPLTGSSQHASHFPLQALIIFVTPSLLVGLALLAFNFVRYGSPGETGYTAELLFRAPWEGGYGLLFSPGRGLFIYAPLTLLLFFGLRPAWRRLSRPYFWLVTGFCVFYWLFYGSWFAWGGTWGWGPRFLLPILPLLMLFVAEPLEGAKGRRGEGAKQKDNEAAYHAPRITHHISRFNLAWPAIATLMTLSLIVNLLGILVDFNEFFLRLGRNDNFVFNWEVFPPLGHWQILREGLVDLIWLRSQPGGPVIEWSVLAPALMLFGLATVGLLLAIKSEKLEIRNERIEKSPPYAIRHTPYAIRNTVLRRNIYVTRENVGGREFGGTPPKPPAVRLSSRRSLRRVMQYASRITFYLLFSLLLTPALTYQMMTATARVALQNEQARADLPALEMLSAAARPGDALLIPMPPFGDVQETSVRVMSYLDRPLPTYVWIESEPRAIRPDERERVWQTVQAEAGRVWLFERWLTLDDPLGVTAAQFNREAFPVEEQWFEQSGKLTLYALAGKAQTAAATPVNVAFQGGLTLVDFTLFGPSAAPDEVVKLRLTWHAPQVSELAAQGATAGGIIVFVQLLDEGPPPRNMAQIDRLLIDLQNFEQSPLLPGQRLPQGYGLRLPDELPPGTYALVAGLYQAATGQRLPRADGSPDDFLYLTNIVVK